MGKIDKIYIVPLLLACLLMYACSSSKPVKIGFIGGLTGRAADLGVAGRNGAILAVEQINAAGGIDGHPIELVIMNDEQNSDVARKALSTLIDQKIECIIGPMTSSMAIAVLPMINDSRSILISPTVTTTELTGKDDNFFRIFSDTYEYAAKSAQYQYERLGHRKVTIIYDTDNRSFTMSWLRGFRDQFEKLGGTVLMIKEYRSSDQPLFKTAVDSMLSTEPDIVLVLGNSVDAAMICQQIRKSNKKVVIVTSEWSATERFVELGGRAVDGVYIAQVIDRNDKRRDYQTFKKAFLARFGHEPGFAGLAGYDSTNIALEAIKNKKGDSIRQYLLKTRKFKCVQHELELDAFGDTKSKTYLTVIKNGQYLSLE